MQFVEWTKPSEVRKLHAADPKALFYDTSTNAPLAGDLDYVYDARLFSPFIQNGQIPIPGRKSEVSDTVEGIWQGLKVIKGKIDPSYFRGKGRKREGKPTGHLYGERVIGYRDARIKIYYPSYKFMFEQCIENDRLEEVYERAAAGLRQLFFDVDVNPDIHNLGSPLSHASVLVSLINQELNKRMPQAESRPVYRRQAREQILCF